MFLIFITVSSLFLLTWEPTAGLRRPSVECVALQQMGIAALCIAGYTISPTSITGPHVCDAHANGIDNRLASSVQRLFCPSPAPVPSFILDTFFLFYPPRRVCSVSSYTTLVPPVIYFIRSASTRLWCLCDMPSDVIYHIRHPLCTILLLPFF